MNSDITLSELKEALRHARDDFACSVEEEGGYWKDLAERRRREMVEAQTQLALTREKLLAATALLTELSSGASNIEEALAILIERSRNRERSYTWQVENPTPMKVTRRDLESLYAQSRILTEKLVEADTIKIVNGSS